MVQFADKVGREETLISPIRGYSRPARPGLVERVGEHWFCTRYNCDPDIFTGLTAVNKYRANGAYRFFHPWGLFRLSPKVKVVRIPSWHRFGNSIIQLVNAFRVAEKFGAETLQFSRPHPFLTGSRSGPFALEWGELPHALTLEGQFKRLDAFRARRASAPEMARVIADLVRPTLTRFIRTPDPQVGEDDLVIHFRCGDVFDSSKSPHPGYGQPPLSFYLAAVGREKPTRTWLISEDDRNPCLQAVASTLMRQHHQIIIRRFGSLEGDLRVLMSARRLVGSRGSFAYIVGHLSDRLQRAYFFEPTTYFGEPPSLPILRALGVDVIEVTDGEGAFKAKLLEWNWANSTEQRQLMLSYPSENLKFGGRA